MPKVGCGAPDAFWLWDGEVELEGQLLRADESRLAARMRHRRRGMTSGTAGRSVPLDWLERQRLLARSICFGQSPSIHLGGLLEVRVEGVQPSRDPDFDYVLAAAYAPVADEHLEALSELSAEPALRYLRSRRSGAPSADLDGWGDSPIPDSKLRPAAPFRGRMTKSRELLRLA
jgi:hypothetical protein